MCARTCDDGYSCVAGGCLRAATVPDVEALDKFGLYQARRLVLAPTEVARLAPGDARCGETPRASRSGARGTRASMLLLRFALDLPPDATILEAPTSSSIARAVDRRGSVPDRPPRRPDRRALGRPIGRVGPRATPRRRSGSAITGRGVWVRLRHVVRVDVRSLVRRWRLHAADDQGIAMLADRASRHGNGLRARRRRRGERRRGARVARAHGEGLAPDVPRGAPRPRTPRRAKGAPAPRGPRLELYVRP